MSTPVMVKNAPKMYGRRMRLVVYSFYPKFYAMKDVVVHLLLAYNIRFFFFKCFLKHYVTQVF